MAKKMLIDATHAEETRVVVVDGSKVEEFDFESENKRQLAGNIYLAKVTRVEPSLQAAFVDYGGNRHGFLAFSEIHPDYYQIPVADREALMAEERAYAQSLREDDGEEENPKPKRRSRRSRSRGGDEAAARSSNEAQSPAPEAEAAPEPVLSETVDPVQEAGIPGMDVVDLAPETDVDQSVMEDFSSSAAPAEVVDDAPQAPAAEAVETAPAPETEESPAAEPEPETPEDVAEAATTQSAAEAELPLAEASEEPNEEDQPPASGSIAA
ncbi:MAG: S1 RNA-binding domain-containing protein, partial [Mangrovicoccus sp.]|nr:S1 RNA-binding domain-containing protein [Mangrovicoccus sp.]